MATTLKPARRRPRPKPVAAEHPDVEHLDIEDGKPVDGIYSERQMKLLVDPLYASWKGPGKGRSFIALANVGLFYSATQPPLVPDVMFSQDILTRGPARKKKENNSYFIWMFGKPPDVAIEIVSNRKGGEDEKLPVYARVGVAYCVIWDPSNLLRGGALRIYKRNGVDYHLQEDGWLDAVNLGLTTWEGEFDGENDVWLRWCDQRGRVLPTGQESNALARRRGRVMKQRADHAERHAREERRRAERLAEKLRKLGHDPED